MRKPKDFDAELKALDDKVKLLKTRKLQQLGELVIATGTDALPIETLVGALLAVAEQKEARTLAEWRTRGTGFFRSSRRTVASAASDGAATAPDAGGRLPIAEAQVS